MHQKLRTAGLIILPQIQVPSTSPPIVADINNNIILLPSRYLSGHFTRKNFIRHQSLLLPQYSLENNQKYISKPFTESTRPRFLMKNDLIARTYTTDPQQISRNLLGTRSKLFLLAILCLAGFGAYSYYKIRRELLEWYWDFTVELGDPLTITNHFSINENYKNLIERLHKFNPESFNRVIVRGTQGLGKSLSVGEAYIHPEKWFNSKLSTREEPWLKLWLSLDPESSEEDVTTYLRRQLIRMGETLAEKHISAPIKDYGWQTEMMKLLPQFTSFFSKNLSDKLELLFKDYKPIEKDETQLLSRLRQYLETHPGWLIVLDDVGLSKLESIEELLPRKGGTIIITTNRNDLGTPEEQIEFRPLTLEESREFLRKYSNQFKNEPDESLNELAKEMEYSPLALAQCCGYMDTHTRLRDVKDFLSEYRNTPFQVFSEESDLVKRHHPVAKMVELNFKKLRGQNKGWSIWPAQETAEEKALYVISLLAPIEIHENLLLRCCERNAIDNLVKLNLLTFDKKQRSYRVSPLVHSLLQELGYSRTLGSPGWIDWFTQTKLLDDVMAALKKHIRMVTLPEELLNFARHCDYVRSTIDNRKTDKNRYSPYHFSNLLFTMGILSFKKDMIKTDKKIHWPALQAALKRFNEHELKILGNIDKAIEYFERALPLFETENRMDKVASTLWDLALSYLQKENIDAAIAAYEKALALFEAQNKMDAVADLLWNLAINYRKKENFDAEIAAYEKSLPLLEAQNRMHEVADTLLDLAFSYGKKENIDAEIAAYEKTLPLFEAQNRTDKMADTLLDLAFSYGQKENIDAAIAAYEKALPLFEAQNRTDKMADTLLDLALSYGQKENIDAEIAAYEKALPLLEAQNRMDEMANTLWNLAINYRKKENFDAAIAAYEKSLPLLEAQNRMHEVADTLWNLAFSYGKKENTDAEIAAYEKALPLLEAQNRMDEVADTLWNLAINYRKKENFDAAIAADEKALSLLEAQNRMDKVADTLWNLALNYRKKENFDVAIATYKKLERLCLELNMQENYALVSCELGRAYCQTHNFQEAKRYFQKTLEISKSTEMKEIKSGALVCLGMLQRRLKEHNEALTSLKEALFILQDLYGEEHLIIAVCLGNLGLLYRNLGDLQKAAEYCKKSLPILEKFLEKSNALGEYEIIDTTQEIKLFLATLNKANKDDGQNPGNQSASPPADQIPAPPVMNNGVNNHIQQNENNKVNSMIKPLLTYGFFFQRSTITTPAIDRRALLQK